MLAAFLVLATGGAAAQAYWSAQTPLSGSLTAGSFSLETRWRSDWAQIPPLFPGDQFESPILRVTETGASGTTLRWRLTPVVTISPNLTSVVFVGSCGSDITIAPGGSYAPSGGLRPGDTVDLCVRITVNENATDVQGSSLTPAIKIVADQVTQ